MLSIMKGKIKCSPYVMKGNGVNLNLCMMFY